MMAGLSYNSGTGELKVNGSSGNDYVEVRYSGTKVQVDLYYIKPDGSTAHSKTSKNISAVTDITFSAQAGDDSMKVTQQNLASSVNLSNTRVQFIGDSGNDSVNNESAVRMHAFGGAGDDRLIGGISADQLFGDSGNDYLRGKKWKRLPIWL
jgi:Ca2+-binding RTX toxin-like protein